MDQPTVKLGLAAGADSGFEQLREAKSKSAVRMSFIG
jgi:hypothetical protein